MRDQQGWGLRSPEVYAGERGGYAPWCGPTAVAQAAGLSYTQACSLLTWISPERYPHGREIVTAWWSDLVSAVTRAGVPAEARPVPERPTLCTIARESLEAGWWMVRVTGHFLLLHVTPQGTFVYDNRIHGEPLATRTHGRRRVTHVARLREGPRRPS